MIRWLSKYRTQPGLSSGGKVVKMHRSKSMSLVAFFLVLLLISSGAGPTVWAQPGGGGANPVAPQSTVLDPGTQSSAAPGQVTEPCRPFNLNLSTGQSAVGSVDPNWKLVSAPSSPTFPSTNAAYTVAPNRGWYTPSSGSWISPFPKDYTGPGGNYVYERTFLTDQDPSYTNIMLRVDAYGGDKQVFLFLDGKSISIGDSLEVAGFSDTSIKGPFAIRITPGLHTLYANVVNASVIGNEPDTTSSSTGLLVAARVTAECGGPLTPVPGPLDPRPRPPGISPSSVEETLLAGTSIRIDKKVQTPKVPPKPEIYFLADTTSSMNTPIATVKAAASTIFNDPALVAAGAVFGAGDYRDFQKPQQDPYAFKNTAPIGSTPAAVTAAINGWSLGYGGDGPEGQFYALHRIAAHNAANFSASGATKIVVWFGDAPGHDPVCTAISNNFPPSETDTITEASLESGPTSLASANIKVIAVSVTSGYPSGLDNSPMYSSSYVASCGSEQGTAGQATRIAAATGGVAMLGVNPTAIVTTILSALTSLPVTVSMTSNCSRPLSTAFSPASVTVTSGGVAAFTETISVTGAAPGDYSCDDWALIGGVPMTDAAGNIIKEHKLIHVPPQPPTPNPSTTTYIYSAKIVCGTVTPLRPGSIPTLQDTAPVVPGLYRSAINIHNFWEKDTAFLQKVAIALPQDQPRGPVTKLIAQKLGPNQAVEVDCYNIVAILQGTPSAKAEFLKGFLVIESPVELEVTAVYTADDLQLNGIAIDVEQIQPHVVRPSDVRPTGSGERSKEFKFDDDFTMSK